MVKFLAGKLLGLGITKKNVIKLQQNQPIKINLKELGSPDIDTIVIFFGEDERKIHEDIKELINSETKVHIDPRLKDH